MPAARIEPTLNAVQRTLLLLDVEPFQALTSEELAEVAATMVEMRFEAGETILTSGDLDGRLYVVVDGVAEQGAAGGSVTRPATRAMAVGLFGLMGVPSDETVRAVEPTHVLVLAREDFIEALSDNPAFAVGCLRGLTLLIRTLLRRIETLEKPQAGGESAG